LGAGDFSADAKEATIAKRLGPVAQDFEATFGLGADDRHAAKVHAHGLALVPSGD
jgi:hypothetical protein